MVAILMEATAIHMAVMAIHTVVGATRMVVTAILTVVPGAIHMRCRPLFNHRLQQLLRSRFSIFLEEWRPYGRHFFDFLYSLPASPWEGEAYFN